jgi:RNA polymerase sigma factor (sigma-70 family)
MRKETKPTDAELVQRCLNGDFDAFELLFRRYQGHVHGLAYHIIQDFEEAKDLTQETFIKAFQRMSQLREPARFASWLFQITRSVCLDYLRSKRKMNAHSLEEMRERIEEQSPSAIPTPEEELEKDEMQDQVLRAIQKLPEHYRLPLTLYHLDGLDYQLTADFMDVPLSTIKWRLHRAREMLKEGLLAMVEETFESKKLPEDFSEQVLEQLMVKSYGMGAYMGIDRYSLKASIYLNSEKRGRGLSVGMRRAAASAVQSEQYNPNVIGGDDPEFHDYEYGERLALMDCYHFIKDTFDQFKVRLEKVILREVEDENRECYALLTLRHGKRVVDVKARVNDGLAMAYRCDAPVFATEQIMERGFIASTPVFYDNLYEGKKRKISQEELERIAKTYYDEDDLIWPQLVDRALGKPRMLEDGRAEAYIRVINKEGIKKAIVENAETDEVALTQDQYQTLVQRALELDRNINQRGWQTFTQRDCRNYFHHVSLSLPEQIDFSFDGVLWGDWDIRREYEKLAADCQNIVDERNRREALSDVYCRWADCYRRTGDKDRAIATLQEGLKLLGDDDNISEMVEELNGV